MTHIFSQCTDDPNVTYIAYNPSGLNCNAHFPFDNSDQGLNTYKEYFESRGQEVAADSKLFDVQRMWNLPSRPVPNKDAGQAGDDDDDDNTTTVPKTQPDPNRNEPTYCERLVSVKLPQEGCFEAPLADAGMYLLTLHLPQLLQHVEHHLVCDAFIAHCKDHLPTLGLLLSQLPPETVIATLTAKRCNPDNCYEKLEWIGDGVLKLVQTDALMMSTDFGAWVKFLPEGYLSAARSVMGSNIELEKTCKRLSFDKFIITNPLARGSWTPVPLFLEREDAIGQPGARKTPDGKICADIIEAMLGLIYVEFDYRSALDVAGEMQITLPWTERVHPDGPQEIKHPEAMAAAKVFTGCIHFADPSLVDEAFTHPTDLASDTPSYQRLEFLGDAVLCMAARDWIYSTFPDALVGDMVLMEAVLVCNETLAYLSVHNGLQRHLRHRDQTLPGRIEEYYYAVRDSGRGLWGTDPPKTMGDIVESLLGAAHVDGGFAMGQEATLHVLDPILELLTDENATKPQFNHPKKDLLELGGKLFSLERTSEEEFALSNPGVEVWHGDEWGDVHPRGQRAVATVRCLGKRIISVCDPATAAATNRACALVLSMLRENPSMESWGTFSFLFAFLLVLASTIFS
jgi:dsRNA-specific ribonuclease